MPYEISLVKGSVEWNSLPVLKLTHYPFTTGPYKPFTLARLCVSDDGFVARLWAFEEEVLIDEASMLDGSCIHLFLQKNGSCLAVTVAAGGGFEAKVQKDADFVPLYNITKEIPHTRWYKGEDLQGVYWGCEVTLSTALAEEVFGKHCLDLGSHFVANITKTQYNKDHFHYGSLFPVKEDKPLFYLPESMGEMVIVNY